MEPDSVAVGLLPGLKFKATWRNLEQDLSEFLTSRTLTPSLNPVTKVLKISLCFSGVLTDHGITDVFCLCKHSELSYFRVRELFDAYRGKDIKIHHYPIKPDVSPDYKDMRVILTDLWNTVLEGSKVYVQ